MDVHSLVLSTSPNGEMGGGTPHIIRVVIVSNPPIPPAPPLDHFNNLGYDC